ncbi:MAG: TIGR01212 family radical SAM protein [Peptococcaceae bacterium]|nr:TIGR01212 family radical SAM protein [Peptococcaceae bacterium]
MDDFIGDFVGNKGDLWGGKRYNALAAHLRRQFGNKIVKVGLDAGCSCPNRDGNVGTGGCLFCSPRGSGDFAGDSRAGIAEQYEEVRRRTLVKWPQARYIAYFQSYTSTYGDPARLARLMREASLLPDVVGTVLATRPDCLGDEVMEVLTNPLTTPLWLEIGLQTIHDSSLEIMNRGHDFACFLNALERLKPYNIPVCAHIVLGLPWETRGMMIETARRVALLPLQGVKIHALYIIKGSELGRIWQRRKESSSFGVDVEDGYKGGEGGDRRAGEGRDGDGRDGEEKGQVVWEDSWKLLSRQEYVELAADVLEILPAHFIIHRLTGDGRYKDVMAPTWTLAKWELLNAIDREMERRGSRQGGTTENRPLAVFC